MQSLRTSFNSTALLSAILVASIGSSSAAAQMGAIPGGWYASRDTTSDYFIGSDISRRPGGTGMTSGYIRATVKNPRNSAALTQAISAEHFRGRRVRVTGYVRRSSDAGMAQLFLRVEGKGLKLATDHTGAIVFVPARESPEERGWIKQAIVVDVPEYSTGLRIGFVSMGADEAWLDDVRFELVDPRVVLTGTSVGSPINIGTTGEIAVQVNRQESSYKKLAKEFVNLDFETPHSRQ